MGAAHLTELAEDEGTLKSFGDALGSKGPRLLLQDLYLESIGQQLLNSLNACAACPWA